MHNIGCGICEDLKLESISEITETCSNKLVDLRLQALNVQACLLFLSPYTYPAAGLLLLIFVVCVCL